MNGNLARSLSELPPLPEDEAGLERLKEKIRQERGFYCHSYKDRCLRRRIAVRMRACGQTDFAGYAALLDRNPAEYELLLDTLTINVTKFFRNPEMWQSLNEHVIPRLMADCSRTHRIWSAGSASGEEAYSVAILLHEWAERAGQPLDSSRFHIVGTDIDRRSLNAARAAEYPEASLLETSSSLRAKWFSSGPPYRLREEVKQRVTFVRRDLLADEPMRAQSLILCRNVIIYFSRDVQGRLFQRFCESLVPGGFLVLGKVETLFGEARARFRPVDNRHRIFEKVA